MRLCIFFSTWGSFHQRPPTPVPGAVDGQVFLGFTQRALNAFLAGMGLVSRLITIKTIIFWAGSLNMIGRVALPTYSWLVRIEDSDQERAELHEWGDWLSNDYTQNPPSVWHFLWQEALIKSSTNLVNRPILLQTLFDYIIWELPRSIPDSHEDARLPCQPRS